jgi:hypothetical protein
VGLFYGVVGNEGIIWILAILYFISALLTRFITLPDNAKTLHHVKGNEVIDAGYEVPAN